VWIWMWVCLCGFGCVCVCVDVGVSVGVFKHVLLLSVNEESMAFLAAHVLFVLLLQIQTPLKTCFRVLK